MLTVKDLKVKIDNKEILKGLNLEIKPGEVHAIMGPNGSGKSTLSNVLSGKKGYTVTGEVKYFNENLLDLEIEERAHKGIFLAFQYPLEIPGVNTNIFLKTSLNAIKKAKGEKVLDAINNNDDVYPILSQISDVYAERLKDNIVKTVAKVVNAEATDIYKDYKVDMETRIVVTLGSYYELFSN